MSQYRPALFHLGVLLLDDKTTSTPPTSPKKNTSEFRGDMKFPRAWFAYPPLLNFAATRKSLEHGPTEL